MTSETINTVVVVLTLLLVAYQTWLLTSQVKRDYDWHRKEKAISYSYYSNSQLREVHARLQKAFGRNFYNEETPISLARIDEKIEQQEEGTDPINEDIVYVLSRLEELGVAVIQGVADIDTVRLLSATSIKNTIMVFKEFIQSVRDKASNPAIWENAVTLALLIDGQQQINDDQIANGEQKKTPKNARQLKRDLETVVNNRMKEKQARKIAAHKETS